MVKVNNEEYTVTAKETLRISNLSELKLGDEINIERCMHLGGRLDGHIVQGDVDTTTGDVLISKKKVVLGNLDLSIKN